MTTLVYFYLLLPFKHFTFLFSSVILKEQSSFAARMTNKELKNSNCRMV